MLQIPGSLFPLNISKFPNLQIFHMAHNRQNPLTKYYSGKLGQLVMQSDGIMRSRPDTSNRVWSEKQEGHLSKFEQAKEYARKVKADPVLSAPYLDPLRIWKRKKKNMGLYQLAIKDFLKPPEITGLRVQTSRPLEFRIHANGLVSIVQLKVRLLSPQGDILEEGDAETVLGNGVYSYLVADPSLVPRGTVVHITAWDLPGHFSEKIFDYPC
jgi:hypothetical protein